MCMFVSEIKVSIDIYCNTTCPRYANYSVCMYLIQCAAARVRNFLFIHTYIHTYIRTWCLYINFLISGILRSLWLCIFYYFIHFFCSFWWIQLSHGALLFPSAKALRGRWRCNLHNRHWDARRLEVFAVFSPLIIASLPVSRSDCLSVDVSVFSGLVVHHLHPSSLFFSFFSCFLSFVS